MIGELINKIEIVNTYVFFIENEYCNSRHVYFEIHFSETLNYTYSTLDSSIQKTKKQVRFAKKEF